MKSLSILFLLIYTLTVYPVNAQAPALPAVESQKISLETKDSPLRTVIDSLFKGSGKNYTIDSALGQPPYDKVTVSLTLKDVTFDEALKTITKAHGLVYVVSDGIYLIKPKPASQSQQNQGSSIPPVTDGPKKPTQLIDLTLRDTPVRTALDSLLKGTGLYYSIAPGVTGNIKSLSLKGVTFDQAVDAVVKAGGITYRLESGVYLFEPKEQETDDADCVTMIVPPMSIKDALAKIDTTVNNKGETVPQPWRFRSGLGNTPMPGARFYQFPKKMAIQLMLAASGLTPPVGTERSVTSKGTTNLYSLFMQDPTRISDRLKESGGLVACGYVRDIDKEESKVSIGAYKYAGRWIYTIFASQAFDADLLEKLFQIAGVNYVIGDRGPVGAVKTVSIQLVDVTLDQALGFTLPSLGLTYKKSGTASNPAYTVNQIFPASPAKQHQSYDPSTRLVSLHLKDASLSTTFETLFKGTGWNYALQPDINKPPHSQVRVTLSIDQMPFDEVLKMICKRYGLSYSK